MEEINRLQENLEFIRKISGWKMINFIQKIGLTKQGYYNIEHSKSPLGKAQYIAIRTIFNWNISKNTRESKLLKIALYVLVDHPEKYNDVENLTPKTKIIVPVILSLSKKDKITSKETNMLKELCDTIELDNSDDMIISDEWLDKILRGEDK